MNQPQYQVTINPGLYSNHLGVVTQGHLAALRHTLRAIEDGSFIERAVLPQLGSVMSIRFEHKPDQAGLAAAAVRACNECFLSLTRELITYLDKMIAVKKLLGELLPVPDLGSVEELRAHTARAIDEAYLRVARDTTLTNPKKVEQFPGLPTLARAPALSYFEVRRVLEHRGGIADKDVEFRTARMVLHAGDIEITQLPFAAPENTGISLSTREAVRVIPKGARIELTETELENVYFTIVMVIAPAVLQVVVPPPAPDGARAPIDTHCWKRAKPRAGAPTGETPLSLHPGRAAGLSSRGRGRRRRQRPRERAPVLEQLSLRGALFHVAEPSCSLGVLAEAGLTDRRQSGEAVLRVFVRRGVPDVAELVKHDPHVGTRAQHDDVSLLPVLHVEKQTRRSPLQRVGPRR
jgi:hypothetical protein